MGFDTQEIAVQNTLQTTDATPVQILTAQMNPSSTGTVLLTIAARNPANGDSKCWMRAVPLKRVGTGAVAILGAQGDLLPTASDSGASSWALSLSTVGNTLSMNVAGAAGTTVHWYAEAYGVIVA